MRSKCRSVLVALVAVLALTVVVAASASAAMERPEWVGPFPMKFTGTSVGETRFDTVGGHSIKKCGLGEGTGEITGPKALVTAGNLLLGVSNATLGYISKPNTGIKFAPKTSEYLELHCETYAVGHEYSVKVKARGPFICSITPIDVTTTKFTIVCKESSGKEAPQDFEGEANKAFLETTASLEGFGEFWGWEQSGIAVENKITTSTATKINA
jgi:hypothetical protein